MKIDGITMRKIIINGGCKILSGLLIERITMAFLSLKFSHNKTRKAPQPGRYFYGGETIGRTQGVGTT